MEKIAHALDVGFMKDFYYHILLIINQQTLNYDVQHKYYHHWIHRSYFLTSLFR